MTGVPLRLLNLNEHPITLRRGTPIAELQKVEILSAANPTQKETTVALPTELEILLGEWDDCVPPDVISNVRALLIEYSDAFSMGPSDLGWIDLMVHSINTGTSVPFVNRCVDIR